MKVHNNPKAGSKQAVKAQANPAYTPQIPVTSVSQYQGYSQFNLPWFGLHSESHPYPHRQYASYYGGYPREAEAYYDDLSEGEGYEVPGRVVRFEKSERIGSGLKSIKKN